MKFEELIEHHLTGTTLDYRLVKDFLKMAPHYHQWGLLHQVSSRSLERLNATDLFEFYLRLYLTGRHKTLQAVVREVRTFVHQDAYAAHYFIDYSLERTHQRLLCLEWYELLPRLEAARRHVLTLAPKPVDCREPVVVSFLKKFY